MKAPRLTRSKTSDPAIAASSASQPYDPRASTGAAVKTSLDDLRSPDGRQRLREQLSSQFPESYTSSLKSSPSATDMGTKDWLGVGQNAAAKSSSSSVDSVQKRLSAVPEKNAAIDVEQAINLLTELKKTATPEQLVALHKALLPTRDSVISTADPTGQRASLIRQKSMLPAGLATRGGASEDLLKKQEEVQPVVKKKKSGHHRLQSKNSIAALDLADDAANPLPAQRAATPDQQYFGAYRPGTLRITNGAASPEPSLRPRTSGGDATSSQAISEAVTGTRLRAEPRTKEASDLTPAQESDLSSSRRNTEPEIDISGAREVLLPAKYRNPSPFKQNRSKRSQEPMQPSTTLAQSREPSLSRQPMEVEPKQSNSSVAATKKASADTLVRRSLDMPTRSIDSIAKSIDDGKVSPIDAPRFAQRGSHRASQISQEYQTDCAVPFSPFEDKQGALAFAQRLSTVYDREDAETTANETPEAALSKLEGSTRRDSDERKSLKATAEGLNSAVRPPPPVSYYSDSQLPKKADSGYVSDASHRSLQQMPSLDASAKDAESSRPYEHSQPGFKEITHRPEPETDDIQSLYTLEQMLKMPNLLPSPSTPPRPEAARKHSSLLKLTGLKKTSVAASRTALDAHSSADSLPLPTELGESSPATPTEAKPTVKHGKKLQKKMPEEVRKQRKAQREKEKERQSSLALASLDPDARFMATPHSESLSSPAPISEHNTPSSNVFPMSPLADRQDSSTPTEALNELLGSTQQPVELDTDDCAATPQRSLSRRQSKKSRRRSRQNTVSANATDTEKEDLKPKRSFSLGRKRSKSKRRSGSLTPKRRSRETTPAVPSIAAMSAAWDENGGEDSVPLYSDYGSVSRTLGTNPYDISTGMFKQNPHHSGPVLDQLQSPHQISTSFSRTKTGGLRGMDSTMASELARMKSRDVAIQNNEDVYDRPRMATPNRRSQQEPPRSRTTMPNALMVEQRSPGWAAKPVFQKSSFEDLNDLSSRPRPHSIAESIPSLPELPVQYLEKRPREFQTSSMVAESSSPAAASPDPRQTEHPGFSNESIADAVMKARRAKFAERVKQGQQPERLRPAGPRMNSAGSSSSSGKVSLQMHGVDERPYSGTSASILIGVDSDISGQEERPATAPMQNDDTEHSVWERQALLWRKRRESIGKTLGKPVEEDAGARSKDTVASPSIVVSQDWPRDSIPPAARRRRKSASEHANAYRDLIGPESASFEDLPLPSPNTDTNRSSAQTTSTDRSSTSTVVIVEQALPAKAYQNPTLINRSRSPGGRVRTPSGSYHPYSPTHAAQAERSRLDSLARLEGYDPPSRGTQSLDMHRRAQHGKNDTLESILGRYDRTLSPVPASEAGSATDSPERATTPKPPEHRRDGLMDRYGGGLQYGYEKGVGLHGSSGLRSSVATSTPRKGGAWSEQFGIDLGDVPVLVQRKGAV